MNGCFACVNFIVAFRYYNNGAARGEPAPPQEPVTPCTVVHAGLEQISLGLKVLKTVRFDVFIYNNYKNINGKHIRW